MFFSSGLQPCFVIYIKKIKALLHKRLAQCSFDTAWLCGCSMHDDGRLSLTHIVETLGSEQLLPGTEEREDTETSHRRADTKMLSSKLQIILVNKWMRIHWFIQMLGLTDQPEDSFFLLIKSSKIIKNNNYLVWGLHNGILILYWKAAFQLCALHLSQWANRRQSARVLFDT